MTAIYLAAATIRPDPATSLHLQSAGPIPAGYYILQLDGPMTPSRWAALQNAGVQPGDYLPFHAYLVHIESGYDVSRLAPLDFVRWLGRFEAAWKIHPEIGTREFATTPRRELADRGQLALCVTLFAGSDAEAARDAIQALGDSVVHWIDRVGPHDVLRITTPASNLPQLAKIDAARFIEETEEVRLYNSTTRWIVQSNIPYATPLHDRGLTGAGQIVGILDTGVNLDHCSFFDTEPVGPTHRKAEAINAWPGYTPGSENPSLHGTHVTGTLLGDAGVDDDTRGIAYGARFVLNTTPMHDGPGVIERFELHSMQGAVLHSNSWGDSAVDYGSLTRGVDVFGYDHEEQLIVFAAGNDVVATDPQNAKNCISVGASMDTPNQSDYCVGGTGPTVDGRRKPEVYAPGCDTLSSNMTTCFTQALTGTSMAAPVVAGVGLLVRQYFLDGFYPLGAANPADARAPSAALLKAVLIDSAVDMTSIAGYPSDLEGWGRLLADDALYFQGDRRRLAVFADVRNADGLDTNDLVEFPMIVAGADEMLKLTLAFTDPPGGVGIGNGPAWVNDLDLEAVAPDGTLYRGNVFAGGVSAPNGSADDRNNVEQIHIPSPLVGLWTIRVRAKAVNVGQQGFALIATGVVWSDPTTIAIDLPDGPPQFLSTDADTTFNVDIIEGTDTLVPGSPTLNYRYGDGAFLTAPLSFVSGTRHVATLPAGDCADSPEFYLSATAALGQVVMSPPAAPAGAYAATVGTFSVVFDDDFESDLGWTVQNENLVNGAWIRAVPNGNGIVGDPTADYDGSGHCYVTGNGNFQDVNGGPTRLVSPALDLSGASDPMVSYARWFSDTSGGDALVVELSGDDGQSWTMVDSIASTQGWERASIAIADFVALTSGVRLRFSTQDLPNNSFTEAAVDAVRITDFACDAGCVPSDVNADGLADGRDIGRFADLLLGATPTPQELCAADLAAPGDGAVTAADITPFADCLLTGCGG